MRVTSKQMYADLLAGIRQQMTTQNEGQISIASGKRFQRPAQASHDYKVSMDLRHSLTGVQSSFSAIKTAKTRLEFSQSILDTMKNIFSRAQTLAIQQSTNPDTSSGAAMAARAIWPRSTAPMAPWWTARAMFLLPIGEITASAESTPPPVTSPPSREPAQKASAATVARPPAPCHRVPGGPAI